MATPVDVTALIETEAGAAPFTVDLTVSGVDPDDGDVEFTIVWGDSTPDTVTESGETEPHTYERPGQYTIVATASVGSDSADADDVIVTVLAPAGHPALDNDGGVCVPWVSLEDVCGDQTSTRERQLLQSAINVATRWLNDATGRRWNGPCTTFVRPLLSVDCGVGYTGSIDLSLWLKPPMRRIIDLRVDGEPIDTTWVYLAGNKLHASHGYGDEDSLMIPWPTQNTDRPPGGIDTWDLTVEHGAGPPEPLREAASRLATEIVKQCCGQECDLPDNVSSISRDGVTITFNPPAPGRTGIPFIDAQIGLYGVEGLAQRRRMFDPAGPRAQIGEYN